MIFLYPPTQNILFFASICEYLLFYPFFFFYYFWHQPAPELPLNRKQLSAERAAVNQAVRTGLILARVCLALTFSELYSPRCFFKGLKLLPFFCQHASHFRAACVCPHTLLSLLGFIDRFRFSMQSISCSGGVSKVQ